MQASFRRSVLNVPRLPARQIAGRRFPRKTPSVLHRNFANPSSFFSWTASAPSSPVDDADRPPNGGASPPSGTSGGNPKLGPDSPTQTPHGRDPAARRWIRRRRQTGTRPIVIPEWFIDRNVKLREDTEPATEGRIELLGRRTTANNDSTSSAEGVEDVRDQAATPAAGDNGNSNSEPIYKVNQALMSEVIASISGGLATFRNDGTETFASTKNHLKLHCPVEGSVYFLDKVVEEAAHQLNADIIRIDAQDLAEIAGDYMEEGPDATTNSLWSLGYDVQQIYPQQEGSPTADEAEGENEESAIDEDDDPRTSRRPQQAFQSIAIPLAMTGGRVIDVGSIMKSLRGSPSANGASDGLPRPLNGLLSLQQGQNQAQQWNDHKLNLLIEAILESNQAKRHVPSSLRQADLPQSAATESAKEPNGLVPLRSTNGSVELSGEDGSATTLIALPQDSPDAAMEQSSTPWPLPKTIVHVRGFRELDATSHGQVILEKVLRVVQRMRRDGQQVMIVGTTASAELTPEISRAGFESIQGEGVTSNYRTMVVTPNDAGPANGLYYRGAARRTREINLRHLLDMLKRVSPTASRSIPQDIQEFTAQLEFRPEDAELSAMLEEQVLQFDEIHRIALTAVGNQAARSHDARASQPLQPKDVISAIDLLNESDAAKTHWAETEQALQKGPEETERAPKSPRDRWLRKLRKKCNHHEKVLLRGVVNPENIRTTFADVHAPPETIESLKMLTMLSLTRPEAFKYGVLATDKITGLLLYGPPGTGKTLLAKAVAKESGASVLEVSGSDVYDMYVGESEKNVRAIFSLAKKLSPCVVFIDEADAIFASRGSGTNRNSHRELINQFLREWDGMTDTNAFIMVATNRPFDLDDAALRRLPRRLLVDLPTEKDREAILQIHLKDEMLHPSISLSELASETPLYSGSDLKNLAVAAALAAVREENETAAKYNEAKSGEENAEPFVFPERRILERRHFEKAMEEITSSVSEDMSSLGAIRKFDEKYGDRRGRKKKMGYGFTPGGEGVKEDAAKVRS